MKPLHEILAKSKNYGDLTLLEHTQQVTQAIELFAEKYNFDFDIRLMRKGAILHDLGKAHPHFQKKISDANTKTLIEQRENENFAHRHEISSLAFLPCFPKEDWDSLIDLVVAHHKSIENDPSGRGILDLVANDREVKNNHLKDWEQWNPYGLQIMESFGLPICTISKQDADKALDYVIEYCEKKKRGCSKLRGLLKSADHFASAFMHETAEQLKPLFEIPNLDFYRNEERKSEIYPLSQVSTDDERKHTLVVAPTGAGKTDFLLRRTKGRVFYTLPYQASINAMWERIKAVVPNKDIRVLHAISKLVVGKGKIDEQILQPLAGSCVKVLTPHQLAAIIFGTSGFETMMLDLESTDVILDEIHTYSDFSRSMVLEIVKTLLRLNCRVHIGTATMPSLLYNELKKILGGNNSVYEIRISDEILDTFDRHLIDKIEDETFIPPILENAFKNKEKVLVIFNTIKKAQEAYKTYQQIFPKIPMMLIHSRFKRGDRVKLETELKTKFNGDGSKEFGNGLSPCLVVSTQVVEVSLDISFDRMITQCAPLDSLIQRFGRVNRRRNKETIGKFKPIHVIKPFGNALPYKKDILEKSFEQLPSNFDLLKEISLQEKIDYVFPTLDMKEIDVHLIYKEDRYTIRELTNYKKAVLVDALEIESATCILSSDREKYLTANWEDRIRMEIPVSYKSISRVSKRYEQLVKIGSYPFVVHQDKEAYKIFGLQLIEHD